MDVANGDDTQRTGLAEQIVHPTSQPRSPVHTPADLRDHTWTSLPILEFDGPQSEPCTGGDWLLSARAFCHRSHRSSGRVLKARGCDEVAVSRRRHNPRHAQDDADADGDPLRIPSQLRGRGSAARVVLAAGHRAALVATVCRRLSGRRRVGVVLVAGTFAGPQVLRVLFGCRLVGRGGVLAVAGAALSINAASIGMVSRAVALRFLRMV